MGRLVFYIIVFFASLGVAAYSEHRGYNKGMRAAAIALEPHLCKSEGDLR